MRRRFVCFSIALSGLALVVGVRSTTAQAVRGVVVDDQNLAHIATATVRIVKDDTPGEGTETDGTGRFLLALPGKGVYRLEVTRLGYRTTRSQAFTVEKGDTVSVEFRVAPDAVLVDPITVTAHSKRGRNLFERHREEWGKGVFLTPQQIDSMRLSAPADVFRKMDHVRLTWRMGDRPDGGRVLIPSVASQEGTGCLLYMVNRVFVQPTPWDNGPWTNYQLGGMLPREVAAVEVYRSVSEVPKELRRYTHQGRKVNCGLVIFWTRSAW